MKKVGTWVCGKKVLVYRCRLTNFLVRYIPSAPHVLFCRYELDLFQFSNRVHGLEG